MDQLTYTGKQILIGTVLGGIFAGAYMLKKNFDVMGKADLSKKTIIYTIIIMIALLAILPFLPDSIPSTVYAVAYGIGAHAVYQQSQKSLEGKPRYSHWNVTAVVICSIIAFLAIFIPVGMIYMHFGIL